MKKLISILLVAVMMLSMGVYAMAETETTDDQVLKLQWYQQSGIDTLFESPWVALQSLVPYMLFESLYVQNSDGTFVPQLATDYTVSEDGLTYTFTIRDGVKWHDGEAFSAEDVVWSLNTKAAVGGNHIAALQYVEGYSALANGEADAMTGISADGNVVTIKLDNPYRGFVFEMCCIKILPKHLLGDLPVEEVNTNEAFWSRPIGTGSYMLDEVSFPDYCTMKINEDYYGEKPTIAKCLFTNYYAGGNDAVVAAMIAGDLDFVWKNGLNDIEVANNVVAQNTDVSAVISTSFYTRFFAFNFDQRSDGNNKADLQKKEVRKAFDMIIDKNTIASFYDGQAVALSTLVNPESAQYNDDIALPEKNIEAAKELLDVADFDYSQTYDIYYYYDDQTTADIMAMIKQDFASAGVKVEPKLITGDLNTLIYVDGNFDLIYCAKAGETDPINMYNMFLSNSNLTYVGLSEERGECYDDAFRAYNATVTEADAKQAGDELQAIAYENCHFIPCYSLNTIQLYNSKKVTLLDTMLDMDNEEGRNWMWDQWKLN